MYKHPFLLVTLATLFTVGCKTVDWKPNHSNPIQALSIGKEPSDEMGQPTKMTVIWKDSVIQAGSSRPTRGFGGRIYLRDAEDQTVRADGELIIYGYDETARSESSTPNHKYVFPRDKFQDHYSKSEIGHSFAVWIPWEKVGGFEKTISLIPVFKTADGKVIQGGQSVCVLPGKKPEDQTVDKSAAPMAKGSEHRFAQPNTNRNNSGVVLASGVQHDDASNNVRFATESAEPESRIRTTTVNVPRSLGRRLAKLPPQAPPRNNRGDQSSENDAIAKRLTDERIAREKRHARLRERLNQDQDPDEPNTSPTQRPVFGQPGGFGG